MATPKKKSPAAHLKGHQFKPGQTGNPNGRPVLTKEQKALRTMTLSSYREVIEMALTGNLDELKAFAQDKGTPVIQVGVATAILKAIKNGDASVLEMFAARIIGKIPDVININSNNTTNVNGVIGVMTQDELRARLKKLRDGL